MSAPPDNRTMATALTQEEKTICQNLVVYGVEYLRTAMGWKSQASKRFLDRLDVQQELATLKAQYQDKDAIQARTQFFAQLKVNQMVPSALTVLIRALRGTKRNDKGDITEMPPERVSYDAALKVLELANIQGAKLASGTATPATDARSININVGGEDGRLGDLAPQQRARVSKILSRVHDAIGAAAEANQRVDTRERLPEPATVEATVVEDDDEAAERPRRPSQRLRPVAHDDDDRGEG